MAKGDRLKEEIGWLKVPFGFLLVIDATLLGWLAQSYSTANSLLLTAGSVVTALVTGVLLWINRSAKRCLELMEKT